MAALSKPKILVTGSTGGVGAPLVAELLSKGFPVRAVARCRDARSAHLESLGAEVVIADLYDPDQLAVAMRGVQRAFYLPPLRPYMAQSAVAFAVAAHDAKLEHIVEMSQWTSHRSHFANMTRQTWLVDALFGMIPGVGHTIFNPGMFAHNFLRTIDYAALLGVFPVLSGAGKAAPISYEDMARVAAVLLAEGPDRHAGERYRPTGPELLDGRDMARRVANAVGHPVIAVDMPVWVLSKVAQQQGVDPFEISSLRHYLQDMRKGAFEFEGGVTSVVERLTGTPAESFETTARRYASRPYARQTVGNRLKALLKFSLTPFYPGHDVERWDKRMAIPAAPSPSLSIEDPRWREAHAQQMARHQGPPLTPIALLHAI